MLTWLKAVGLSTLAVIAPIKPMLLAVIVLTSLDTLSGIMAAHKRGEKITSAGMRRSISKMLVYVASILAAFVAEKWLLEGVAPLAKLCAGAIGLVELKSCLENFNTVAGGSVFKSLLGKLGSSNDKPPAPPADKT